MLRSSIILLYKGTDTLKSHTYFTHSLFLYRRSRLGFTAFTHSVSSQQHIHKYSAKWSILRSLNYHSFYSKMRNNLLFFSAQTFDRCCNPSYITNVIVAGHLSSSLTSIWGLKYQRHLSLISSNLYPFALFRDHFFSRCVMRKYGAANKTSGLGCSKAG